MVASFFVSKFILYPYGTNCNLDDLTVDVSIRRNKKNENKTCECSKGCKCGGKRQ